MRWVEVGGMRNEGCSDVKVQMLFSDGGGGAKVVVAIGLIFSD